MTAKSLILIPLGFISLTSLCAQSSIDPSENFTWSGNTGWINLHYTLPSSSAGVLISESYASGYAWDANTGWINFGDGTPNNGFSYSNTNGDHGVNINEIGELSGYAWSSNTGWVNFGWAAPSDAHRPRINLINGQFSGYAWNANTGWVNLESEDLTLNSIVRLDTDADGIPDSWEMRFFGNLTTASATSNSDTDSQTDLEEYAEGTNPTLSNAPLSLVITEINNNLTSATVEFAPSLGRLYHIEATDDLTDPLSWADSSLGAIFPSQAVTTTESFTFSALRATKYFFRIKSTVPFPN